MYLRVLQQLFDLSEGMDNITMSNLSTVWSQNYTPTDNKNASAGDSNFSSDTDMIHQQHYAQGLSLVPVLYLRSHRALAIIFFAVLVVSAVVGTVGNLLVSYHINYI